MCCLPVYEIRKATTTNLHQLKAHKSSKPKALRKPESISPSARRPKVAPVVGATPTGESKPSRMAFAAGAPVLCFGDSLTAGYHGVWHSAHAPQSPPNPNRDELAHARFRPYSLRLGARLAAAAGLPAAEVTAASALRFAEDRAYSGWAAAELHPRLVAALHGGPWRAVVLLAGTNDIVLYGVSAEATLARVEALCSTCEDLGVPVLVVTPPDCATDQVGPVPKEEAPVRRACLSTFAAKLREASKARGRVVVDAYRWFPAQDNVDSTSQCWSSSFWDDGLHLSCKGSDVLADLVFDALSGASSEPDYTPGSGILG